MDIESLTELLQGMASKWSLVCSSTALLNVYTGNTTSLCHLLATKEDIWYLTIGRPKSGL